MAMNSFQDVQNVLETLVSQQNAALSALQAQINACMGHCMGEIKRLRQEIKDIQDDKSRVFFKGTDPRIDRWEDPPVPPVPRYIASELGFPIITERGLILTMETYG